MTSPTIFAGLATVSLLWGLIPGNQVYLMVSIYFLLMAILFKMMGAK